MYDILSQEMDKLHSQIRIVPVDLIKTIEEDTYRVQNGEYGSDLIDLIVNDFFSFELPELPFTIRSIVVAATPSPYVMVRFKWKGKNHSFPNESFYPYMSHIDRVEGVIRDILISEGYQMKEASGLPMKPLAVRSGLGLYGRNNITYVNGMGSFIALKAFFSDIPCDDGILFPLQRMEVCTHCTICLTRCPTGAIKTDRHIMKAEECLTYFNEFIDAEGFPDWLPDSAHNSLHGCIICQALCPQNKPYLKNIETPVVFDEYETQQLLDGVCLGELPRETANKVRLLCLEDYLPLLPRNLSVLLAKESSNNA